MRISLAVIAGVAMIFAMGYLSIFYKKTVGVAHQNADTEIYRNTNQYVSSKQQEALKLYREYSSSDAEDKKGICSIVINSFADFPDDKLDGPVKEFVMGCKYGGGD